MNLNNLINECLNYFSMIGDILVCKLKVKFVISLASLIKKKKVHNHLKKLYLKKNKFGLFQWEMGLFFPKR